MDDAGQTPPAEPQASGHDDTRPSSDPRWGRWALVGVLGCLGLALLAALPPLFAGFLMLRAGPAEDALDEARVLVDEAVRDARVDPRVTRVLGQPIRSHRRTFSSDFDLAGGEFEAVVELSGPDGEGQLHLGLRRAFRRWRIDEVRFEELRRDAVDLLAPARER